MFRSLSKLLNQGWQSRTDHPHDLTAGDLLALQALRKSEGWRAFTQVLDAKIEELAEELLTAQTTEHMWAARGKIAGLRESILMVEAIITQKEGKDAATERAATNLNKRAEQRARLLTNSPFSRTN